MTLTDWYNKWNDDLGNEDRGDALFALYVYCMNYHHGQWSEEYEIMSSLDARLTDNAIDGIMGGTDEWYNAHNYYKELIRDFSGESEEV